MKILVVDDEKDVQVLFEQRFRKEIREGLFNFIFAFSASFTIKGVAIDEPGTNWKTTRGNTLSTSLD